MFQFKVRNIKIIPSVSQLIFVKLVSVTSYPNSVSFKLLSDNSLIQNYNDKNYRTDQRIAFFGLANWIVLYLGHLRSCLSNEQYFRLRLRAFWILFVFSLSWFRGIYFNSSSTINGLQQSRVCSRKYLWWHITISFCILGYRTYIFLYMLISYLFVFWLMLDYSKTCHRKLYYNLSGYMSKCNFHNSAINLYQLLASRQCAYMVCRNYTNLHAVH